MSEPKIVSATFDGPQVAWVDAVVSGPVRKQVLPDGAERYSFPVELLNPTGEWAMVLRAMGMAAAQQAVKQYEGDSQCQQQ